MSTHARPHRGARTVAELPEASPRTIAGVLRPHLPSRRHQGVPHADRITDVLRKASAHDAPTHADAQGRLERRRGVACPWAVVWSCRVVLVPLRRGATSRARLVIVVPRRGGTRGAGGVCGGNADGAADRTRMATPVRYHRRAAWGEATKISTCRRWRAATRSSKTNVPSPSRSTGVPNVTPRACSTSRERATIPGRARRPEAVFPWRL